ncbi:MAG: MFS transporter [Brevibacterium yomogidense]|uniref:Putative integral membrane transport protein n=1 Tax=Brevibacterium yomogidense TaxID=946573 RepID=A0A1X6WTV5_9MICO|nr:MFS transporter [Brevibacterium yomogidense]SLM88426.1 putative integral membrane transport protein [Brevibacterium yomogidense]
MTDPSHPPVEDPATDPATAPATGPANGPANGPALAPRRRRRIHPAWWVAAVAFLALFAAAGFRGAPGALMVPLHEDFGWSMSIMSIAVSINLVLYGLVAPFAAALMDRFGLRRVISSALVLIAVGAGGSVAMTASWHLLIFWGLLIGAGTGAMALVFAATIAERWFVKRRGLVMGALTAGAATGQLVILPPVAALAETIGWRPASLVIAGVALIAVPLVALVLRDYPEDRGVMPYGADPATYTAPVRTTGGAMKRAIDSLRYAACHRTFWALAIAFAICGATTNGLIGIHFIPSAHDHGMAATTAAGLLAVVGVFDIIGTVASGWLTDRFDPRILLLLYYGFRGVGLLLLPWLLSDSVHPSMLLFIIIYGLDWVATVPPTVALCREFFGERGTIVFGWVFASHQIGAAAAAAGAGVIRDVFGTYTYAWWGGAAMCAIAAVLSLMTRTKRRGADRDVVASSAR